MQTRKFKSNKQREGASEQASEKERERERERLWRELISGCSWHRGTFRQQECPLTLGNGVELCTFVESLRYVRPKKLLPNRTSDTRAIFGTKPLCPYAETVGLKNYLDINPLHCHDVA